MTWTRLTARRRGDCQHCHRAFSVGQVVFIQKLPNNPPGFREIAFHKKCLTAIVNAAPDDQDRQAFFDLRDRIAAQGVAFPS